MGKIIRRTFFNDTHGGLILRGMKIHRLIGLCPSQKQAGRQQAYFPQITRGKMMFLIPLIDVRYRFHEAIMRPIGKRCELINPQTTSVKSILRKTANGVLEHASVRWKRSSCARLGTCHDESGDAVRRATENGNGALVVLIKTAE